MNCWPTWNDKSAAPSRRRKRANSAPSAEEDRLSAAEREKIESLFDESAADRSKVYELKRELDRLGVFGEYENRFLDLFKKKH